MVRQLSSEANLLNVATAYTRTNVAYGSIHNYGNVTLPEDGLLLLYFETYSSAITFGSLRFKIGGIYAYALTPTSGTYYAASFLVYLPAGTYEIDVEGAGFSGGTVGIRLLQAGFAAFSDLSGSAVAAYAGAIAETTTVRATPLGNIKNTVYCVVVYAVTAGAPTNLENPGDAFTNGVQVLLDGVQQSWSERSQGGSNDMAAGGKCYVSASAGTSHSITITEDNAATDENVCVAVCPWILPYALSEAVTLDITQGSTLYLTEEPLDANPTKYVYVGKVRAVSFGAATDYYASASATGISAFSYTFESVDISQCLLQVYGLGGCIALIAVDLR
jgi:hypothetical protein